MILNEILVKEKIMSCPYFKEGYFGICVAPDAIHVPGIDEMERFCFREGYGNCPNIAFLKDSQSGEESCTNNGHHKLTLEQLADPLFAVGRDRDTGRSRA